MPPVVGKIICGDNCDVLGRFPDDCIDLVVTSPPYDNLRDYGGHAWDFYGVAWQLKRVLKPGGVIVWVVGDATVDRSETGTSADQAKHFRRLGLLQHDTMIYGKNNPVPLTHNRYEQAWEYMFIFAKGAPRVWNPILRQNRLAGAKNNRKSANATGDTKAIRQRDEITIVGKKSFKHNAWFYNLAQRVKGHPATFPEALAADHIKSWSNEGDLILDPFNGSGTTTAMACKLKRRFIGIEVDPTYCELAVRRMGEKGFFA